MHDDTAAHRPSPARLLARLGRAVRPPGDQGAILCLHAIDAPAEPSRSVVAVTPAELDATLDVLDAVARVVPLREFVERRRAGRSTRGLAVLTFDDAYHSLTDAIARVLRPRGVPATLFVVSEASRTGATFWWDRVDDLAPAIAPERWRAFEDAIGLPQAYRDGQPAAMGPLRPLRQWILREHAGRWPAAAEPHLRALEQEAGLRTVQRAMTYEELAAATSDGLVDVGVHTRTHCVLPLLDDDELRGEVAGCHATLREQLPERAVLPVLAIPFGLGDARTVRLAADAGMRSSLTLGNFTVDAAHDVALPRFCLSRDLSPVRLGMRVIGVEERVRRLLRPAADAMYPPLPSPTT